MTSKLVLLHREAQAHVDARYLFERANRAAAEAIGWLHKSPAMASLRRQDATTLRAMARAALRL